MRSAFWAVTIAIAAIGLTGCGKVLDWPNAEVSNGKIYEQGANKPFSGKVTNVPQEKILPYRDGWTLAIRPINGTPNWANRVRIGGSLCDLTLDDGQIDGEMVCTDNVSKQVLYKVNLKAGALHGKFVLYDNTADKKPLITVGFVNGKMDGTHKFVSPKNQQVLYQVDWNEGMVNGEEARFDEDSGKKTLSRHFKQGQLDGESYTWANDGTTVLYHTQFRNGKQEGIEEVFYPSGKKRSEVPYVNGNEHGIKKIWNEAGQMTDHARYDSGSRMESMPLPGQENKTPSMSQADVEVCLGRWIAAYRKGAGADAVVRMDQAGEWEEWCRAGRQPN